MCPIVLAFASFSVLVDGLLVMNMVDLSVCLV